VVKLVCTPSAYSFAAAAALLAPATVAAPAASELVPKTASFAVLIAVCCAVDTGLLASEVLSTLLKPT
jgi:hypothetical protein